jgi:peptidoglycan hydrolase-like protein with peptidoglycan-binding domain
MYDNETTNQVPSRDAKRTARRDSRGALYTSVGAAALGAAGLAVALVVGLGGSAATADHADHGTHRATPVIVVPSSDGSSTGSSTGGSSTPSVQPSATTRLLQEQLGQLNYYDGPINGIDSPQVHQVIEYLQRDAHLPQNGVLTPATETALNRMLVNGNNQMGGNG